VAKRLFLIDGTAFAYRSYYAIRGLTNSKGQPTNAVYGFARLILKILREHNPSHLAVVFDAPGKTFREDMYPEYKANRKETPEDLIAQLPSMDRLLEALNVPILRVEGVEADDVIGALARRGEEQGYEVAVVTGDKDALQLVTDHVRVFDPNRGNSGFWYGSKEVQDRFGVPPEHVIDALGLMGDASDNVPGVPGVGEKTARKLLDEYGAIEGVYEHLDAIKGKQRENLEHNRDRAFLSRDLVTIKTDVDVRVSVDALARKDPDRRKLVDVLSDFEFQSLLEEYAPDAVQSEEVNYRLVTTAESLKAMIAEMRKAGTFAIDTETTSTDPMRAELVGVSMCCRPGAAYYVPVGHAPEALRLEPESGASVAAPAIDRAGQRNLPLFEGPPGRAAEQLVKQEALEALRPLFEDASAGKVGHNIKYDLVVLEREGVGLNGITMDTMVASYLTDPSRLRHNLFEVCLQHLKRKMIPIADLIGRGASAITFDKVPVASACTYSCEDADITWRLTGILEVLLRERQLDTLFQEIELPLIRVLARMEMAGIAINPDVFDELRREIQGRLKVLETQIFEEAGEVFQINSPKQLQEVLFGKLGLRPVRKTKTGYSTDVDVLEELSREHPLPAKVLEYRMLEKLRGTYVDALPKLVHPDTGRIHTSFNQAVTATGRLSSSDPNLQNIPIRTEIGRRIREGFVPGRKNRRFISADYSQIELRILAHLSGDEHLKEAFFRDEDIHRDTAARVFGTAPDRVTPEMRRQAKAVNFGVVYGISPFGLAKNLGISQSEAARFIEGYFVQYPGVQTWIDGTLEKAREDGFVVTLLNRRRYLPELNADDAGTRKAAERAAMNTPVQGTAADVIKKAMIHLDRALGATSAQLLLQVHDELLVEADEAEAEQTAGVMKEVMETALELDVPLKVEIGIGNNWAEVH